MTPYTVIRRVYPEEVNAGALLSGKTVESYVDDEQANFPDKLVFAVYNLDPPSLDIVYEDDEPANSNKSPERQATEVRDAKKWIVLCVLGILAIAIYQCRGPSDPLPPGVEYVNEQTDGCVYETRRIGGELWIIARQNAAEATGRCFGPVMK